MDTPPADLSDTTSSDDGDQEDGPFPGAVSNLKGGASQEVGTPTSCGGGRRKKMWRKRRKPSNSKDDEKDSGFLDKVQGSGNLARRQTLPPLQNVSPPSHLTLLEQQEPLTSTLIESVTILDSVSKDSTPGPGHTPSTATGGHTPLSGFPDTPILSNNGDYSPEISELLQSLKHSRRHSHRRNLSNGSIRTHRRVGSSGSATSFKGLEPAQLNSCHSRSGSNLNTSKRGSTDLDTSRSRRGSSGSGILYSKMDSNSDMDSDSNDKNSSAPIQRLDLGSEQPDKDASSPTLHSAGDVNSRGLYSNEESSLESDGQGHDADGETTSDENRFDRCSGTEPNETTESNMESSAASPSQGDSEDVTSCSTSDILESDLTTNLIPKLHTNTNHRTSSNSRPDQSLHENLRHPAADQSHDTNRLPHKSATHYLTATPTQPTTPPSDHHSNHQVAMLVSHFESNPSFASEGEDADTMSIPLHIQRKTEEGMFLFGGPCGGKGVSVFYEHEPAALSLASALSSIILSVLVSHFSLEYYTQTGAHL